LTASRALTFFGELFEEHLAGPCDVCRATPEADVTGRYRVNETVIADVSSLLAPA
jgi:hypothetical protein